ncbi:hypothetical protein CVT25_006974 [Psilocybe cyanescens]|uniref:Uncharacterized protein n=1 Tax=Psilocybe cyanescens TaxID=93625 RepID=A0A409VSN2_PSICY|nr:hypothetical protein CVT25_006974 [Psilocybe cyanescens]
MATAAHESEQVEANIPDSTDSDHVVGIPGGWGRQLCVAELKKKQHSKASRNSSGDYPLVVFPPLPAGTEPLSLKRVRKASTLPDGTHFVPQVKKRPKMG